MSRPAKTDPPYRLTLALPSSLVGELDLLIIDPATGKVPYAARAKIITALLADLLVTFQRGDESLDGKVALALLRRYTFGE